MEKMKRHLLFAAVAAALPMASVQAGVIVLNFEDINASYPATNYANIQQFYNGGNSSQGTSGTNYGVSFEDNAQAICLNTLGTTANCSNASRGGLGDPNSQRGGVFFTAGSGTTMNVDAGFDTGFSFFYTAVNQGGAVQVFDGLDGTGSLLASLNLSTTSSACSDNYGADFCPFVAAGVNFAGTAKSINWGGVDDQVVFDDITFGSSNPGQVPVPGTLGIVGLGLVGLARMRRRKK
jgi:hypothetical protein